MTTDLLNPASASRAPAPGARPKPAQARLTHRQSRRLQQMAELTRLELQAVDLSSGTVLESTSSESLTCIPTAVWKALILSTEPRVIEVSKRLMCCVLPLPDIEVLAAVAIGFVLREPGATPPEIVLSALQAGWSQETLNRWTARQPVCSLDLLRGLVDAAAREVVRGEEVQSIRAELQQTEERLAQTHEEINLLHSLTQNLQVSRSPVELSELCLGRLHSLIRPGGSAIWIDDRKNMGEQFVVRGNVPFDDIGLAQLVARFDEYEWTRPLLKNNVDRTLLGLEFPGLRNFALVPVADGTHRSGWIVCCNLPHGREFGTVEASLLSSVSIILGTHVRNIELYQQHDDLMLSFVRSLVSTLDAKDPYTRGHSERVALIARRLGREMQLEESDLQDIYLSGLLHDIGKIGVDDRILQKVDRLTEDEFRKIKQHPMIGYSILFELKNLRKILPGVRNHHEQINGSGYPDCLKGDEIPLMARILAVADSYDAMSSDRSYRRGMPLEKIEEVFREGSGRQWDSRVVEAYFACREDILRICATYSPSDGNLLAPQDET